MVVQADEGTTEGEGFAIGSEDGWVDDTGRWYDESYNNKDNTEGNKNYRKDYLILVLHTR